MNRIIREENRRRGVNTVGKESDEQSLIIKAQKGDQKAFGLLIRQNQKRLMRFVFGLVGSFDVAEDIVQEALVKAYTAIQTFQTEYTFYPWLATIARNLAYNHIHREEKKESLDSLQEKGYNPQSVDLGPLDRLLDDEAQKRLFQAVAALPAQYRAVFVLRHFEDMEYTEIANYLKIPPGTVDSRLYRARQMLLEALKDLL
jgi:RNA polymerase sigma-70 factor (ECF subfamily)